MVIKHLDTVNFFMAKNPFFVNRSCEVIDIPSTFSVSDNVEDVIKKLREIYTLLKKIEVRKVIFDHSKCVKLGLSASTIMDIIVLAVEKYREAKKCPLEMEGKLPYNTQTSIS